MPDSQKKVSTGRTQTAQLLLALLLATLLAMAVAQGSSYGEADMAGEATGVSSGVFTVEQAERGAAVYLANCSGCHGANLEGGFGPQLAPIGEHWHGSTLGSLYDFVSTAMPFSAPGSLEPQQYADVIAFVLQSNGFAAGEVEIAPDKEALEVFVIDAPASASMQ